VALSSEDLKSKQLEFCPSQSKVSLAMVNTVDDPASKATFYVVQAVVVDSRGNQQQQEPGYRYSQRHEFHDTLIHDSGAIRGEQGGKLRSAKEGRDSRMAQQDYRR
jgi:hypothetical protein